MTDPVRPSIEYASIPDRPAASRFRWVICGLLFFATTINYMDRQILGILADTLKHEIGWTEAQYSYIVMAFQAAYAIGLISAGWLIDRFGTKLGYSGAVLFWSIAAAAHGLVKTPFGFGVARFALGIGEAGNFPAAIKTVAEWFPKKERAFATGLFNSGSNIGAVFAPAIVPYLTLHFGWQASFVVLGATGLFWMVAWHLLYSAPEDSRSVSEEELAHIHSDGDQVHLPPIVPTTEDSAVFQNATPEPAPSVKWSRLFSLSQTWAYVITSTVVNPIWWFYLYWLPKFFAQQYSLDLKNLGLPLVVVYLMAMIGSIGGGWLSSKLIDRGFSTNFSRKAALLVAVLCVAPVASITHISNVWLATFVAGLATLGHQALSANLYTMASDWFPRRAVASVVGLGSGAGSIAAIAFSFVVGQLLESTHSYAIPFLVAGIGYPLVWVTICLLSPRWQPVDETRL